MVSTETLNLLLSIFQNIKTKYKYYDKAQRASWTRQQQLNLFAAPDSFLKLTFNDFWGDKHIQVCQRKHFVLFKKLYICSVSTCESCECFWPWQVFVNIQDEQVYSKHRMFAALCSSLLLLFRSKAQQALTLVNGKIEWSLFSFQFTLGSCLFTDNEVKLHVLQWKCSTHWKIN